MLSVFLKELTMKSFNVTYFNWFRLFGLSALINLAFLISLCNVVCGQILSSCIYAHAHTFMLLIMFFFGVCMHVQELHTSVLHSIRSLIVHGILIVSLTLTALRNIELASFLRWYVAVELHDPAYAKRFYCTYELLEENMMKVRVYKLLSWGHLLCLFFLEY